MEFIDNMKLKQAIIVRTDLGMGKIAGQVAHAAVEAAESIRTYCPEWHYSWLDDDSLQPWVNGSILVNLAMALPRI